MSPFVFYCLAMGALLATGLLSLWMTRHTPDAGASLFPLAEDPDTYSLPFNCKDIER